ncbi:hypothetical protein A2625_04280 [candidate division WOR-1 bacterium RIFCSPHIGHO2_01_FULL_53_15]|uniref:YggT family protein n=1 Tax=candidate division WOR-1 bacterium RIFCSPHIGHO2_01_FULL_53_15 TaxID=1802564 RepID=A0A1F4Q2L0_UNCSA|nr:MAG: hypothetical protein A2625_04280 [candidate division WOR-1 bacterium RIFCSPHIGHO2_01_FULL_53_15]OGC13314.1 MAG: hypothetical protein A3D23_02515 [candidate division WOR-1 bacterium RIFCSPHIGHO2_02_FULL_53_26]
MGDLSFAVNLLFIIFYLLFVIRAVLPWLRHDRQNPIIRPVYLATDWLVNPIRAGLPPQKIGLDVSPYVAIILLYLFKRFFFF